MNRMRFIFVTAVLVGLLASGFTSNTFPIGEPTRAPIPTACEAVILADIPARRSDYQRLDNQTDCAKGGSPLVVPVTGANRAPVFAYDATAAMNAAIVLSSAAVGHSPRPAFIYDATGAMQNAVVLP